MNNGSQDMPMGDMPPIDMQPGMGNDMGGNFMPQGQDMMGGQPPMDMGGNQSQFDTNFDAGVEADEEQDPKKYIQQLTGKLSQTLRKFNDNNGQPDVDLNKYVAGMIVKQAMEGLSPDDADEIIEKVKADEDFSMGDGSEQGGEMGQMPPQDNGQMMNDPNQGQMPMSNNNMPPQMNEWLKKNRNLEEIVNGVLNSYKDDKKPSQELSKEKMKSFKSKPFIGPKFN